MKFLIYVTLFFISFSAFSDNPWKSVGSSGKVQFALIDSAQEKNADTYRKAAADLCADKKWCKVLFWSDPEMIPKTLPMSEKQSKALRADWIHNKYNGHEKMLFSCEIIDDPSQCFSN